MAVVVAASPKSVQAYWPQEQGQRGEDAENGLAAHGAKLAGTEYEADEQEAENEPTALVLVPPVAGATL